MCMNVDLALPYERGSWFGQIGVDMRVYVYITSSFFFSKLAEAFFCPCLPRLGSGCARHCGISAPLQEVWSATLAQGSCTDDLEKRHPKCLA